MFLTKEIIYRFFKIQSTPPHYRVRGVNKIISWFKVRYFLFYQCICIYFLTPWKMKIEKLLFIGFSNLQNFSGPHSSFWIDKKSVLLHRATIVFDDSKENNKYFIHTYLKYYLYVLYINLILFITYIHRIMWKFSSNILLYSPHDCATCLIKEFKSSGKQKKTSASLYYNCIRT